MKTFLTIPSITFVKQCYYAIRKQSTLRLLALVLPLGLSAAETGKTFPTPEEAVAALVTAVGSQNTNALREIFGPGADEIANPDPVQAARERSEFARALKQFTNIQRESESRCVLEAGENHWPFPIPIVKRDGQWYFDAEAGREEILDRRIGKNELATLETLRACVEAEREYATHDHNGDQVLEFAQKFISTTGTQDGLYWPLDLDGETSPLGPLVANAQDLSNKHHPLEPEPSGEPFHGYFFKILTGQGKHAPGGKHSFLVNKNMLSGFAFVAWPAAYGDSGVMTFTVNQQGRIYQKDLGPKTAKIARDMKEYDPDQTWHPSSD